MNADALISIVLTIVFLIWFYGPWQNTCTDYARQIIFEQRDKLFDIAASGRMPFDSKEYKMLRASLNAVIRFAHEATLPRMLYLYIFLREKDIDYKNSSLYRATEQIHDSKLYAEVQILLRKSMITTGWLIIAKSLPCVIVLTVLSPLVVLLAFCAVFVSKIKRRIGSMLKYIGGVLQAEAEFEEKFTC